MTVETLGPPSATRQDWRVGHAHVEPRDRAVVDVAQHGLRRDQLFLPPAEEETAHVRLPREYVLDFAETERTQRRIREVFQLTFDLWEVFFDGLQQARERTA